MSKFLKVEKDAYYARIFWWHGPERLKKALPFPGLDELEAVGARNLIWTAYQKMVGFEEVPHPLNKERTAVYHVEIWNADIHRIMASFVGKTFGISKEESDRVRELAVEDLAWVKLVGTAVEK